jgi:2-dehydro-3-deoxyphosphogluconate aldolase/(4S)-4-hydroxy-2-oxoglutarate aldolase
MNASEGLQHVERSRAIAIVRGIEAKHMIGIAEALLAGGIPVMEVTLNTDGAPGMIQLLQERMGDRMFIGAGTVLNVDDARMALDAGASFLVTPNTDEDVIEFAAERGVPIYPGALTPTEIVRAWNAGATAVKLFPVASLGVGYLKELQGPLSHIPMMAVGGVRASNVAELLRIGCYGVGVGGSLFAGEGIERGDYRSVTENAAAITGPIQAYLRETGAAL